MLCSTFLQLVYFALHTVLRYKTSLGASDTLVKVINSLYSMLSLTKAPVAFRLAEFFQLSNFVIQFSNLKPL